MSEFESTGRIRNLIASYYNNIYAQSLCPQTVKKDPFEDSRGRIPISDLGKYTHYMDYFSPIKHPSRGRPHNGIDIVTSDRLIRAPFDCRIIFSSSGQNGGYGGRVNMWSPEKNIVVSVSHLDRIYPRASFGSFVPKGSIIGREGNTGGSRGVHTHLEVFDTYGTDFLSPLNRPHIHDEFGRYDGGLVRVVSDPCYPANYKSSLSKVKTTRLLPPLWLFSGVTSLTLNPKY